MKMAHTVKVTVLVDGSLESEYQGTLNQQEDAENLAEVVRFTAEQFVDSAIEVEAT